jgi:uncharacterized membrane protein YeaQ/YmgE (transglycosylase-associated protein family)
MQTAAFFLALRPFLELLAVASLCSWIACLAIGLSFFSPSKAALIGTVGIVVGFAIWALLDLPTGPLVSDLPILPSVIGTVLVAFTVEFVSEARESAFRITGPAPEEASARRGGAGAASAPEAEAEAQTETALRDDAQAPGSSPASH